VKLEAVANTHPAVFNEKLLPSFWAFVSAAIVLPSVYLVFLPINELVGLLLGSTLTLIIWVLMVASSARIRVAKSELWVGKAHIPVQFLSEGREIQPELRFGERGPGLDSRAFVRFQMGIKPLVRFENIDPNDPVPYWLIATRKPKQLLEAVAAG